MSWTGKTKIEVEAELLGRVDRCRALFEHFRKDLRDASELTYAAMGSPDGTLAAQQTAAKAMLLRHAQENYMAALKDFSHFILSGTLPADDRR